MRTNLIFLKGKPTLICREDRESPKKVVTDPLDKNSAPWLMEHENGQLRLEFAEATSPDGLHDGSLGPIDSDRFLESV